MRYISRHTPDPMGNYDNQFGLFLTYLILKKYIVVNEVHRHTPDPMGIVVFNLGDALLI